MNATQRPANLADTKPWLAVVTSPRLWVALLSLLMLVNPALLIRGGRWLCSQPQSNGTFNLLPLVLDAMASGSVVWIFTMISLVLVFIYQLTQTDRWERVWKTLTPFVIGVIGFFTLPFLFDFDAVERKAFLRISANARPIVKALEEFKSDNGDYPAALFQLAPTYLSELPYPGVLGARTFSYSNPGRRYNYIVGEDGAPIYELYVRVGIEDNFFYIPDENKRERLLEALVMSRQSDNWIFEDT